MYLSLEISDFDQFNIDVNKDEMNDFKKRNDALFDGLGRYILKLTKITNDAKRFF